MSNSLAKHFGTDKVDFRLVPPSEFVHCIIDVQREFCDPEHSAQRGTNETVRVAEHIANVAPEFRQAHIPTYMVYFARNRAESPDEACGGLFKVTMDDGDTPVAKNENSAFEGSDISDKLKKDGIKTLLVSGFNTNACVKETVMDALSEGFNVWLLEDCLGNDNRNTDNAERNIKDMTDKGALRKQATGPLAQ